MLLAILFLGRERQMKTLIVLAAFYCTSGGCYHGCKPGVDSVLCTSGPEPCTEQEDKVCAEKAKELNARDLAECKKRHEDWCKGL